MLIGGMVRIITANGGMQGVVKWLSRKAKGPRSGQLMTFLMDLCIFFDDYSNTLVVGNTMRPIADKLKESGDVKAAMDAYAAAKTIPDWLDGSIGGEAPYIRAMLGEAECMRELSPSDTAEADRIIAHIAETSPDALQRARLLIRLGRKDEAGTLLEKKLAEWKAELKKRDSGYYSAQPAYLSYLEPSAADRKRRFSPLIKAADELMEEIK